MNTDNTNIEYKGIIYTPQDITNMREWAKDCIWADMDSEDIDNLRPIIVLRGIEVNYNGGLKAFMQDSIPVYRPHINDNKKLFTIEDNNGNSVEVDTIEQVNERIGAYSDYSNACLWLVASNGTSTFVGNQIVIHRNR